MADISKIKLPNNSVVNIKDARITGVDNAPTSGSRNVVKSGGVKTALDGMIPYGTTLMPTNPFGGKGVYINSMDNAFHSAEKRFWVKITLHSKTVSGVSYPYADTSKEITDPDYWVDSPVIYTFTNTQAANIFNGSYESNCQCPTGQYMKIHIQFSPFSDSWNPATAPRMSGFPYGSYYLSYYYKNTPGRASQLRVYNIYAAHTIGWHLYSPTVFAGSLTGNYIECFTDNNDYSRTCVEFIIYGKDSGSTAITQIDYKLSQPDLASSGSTVTKYGDQSLYHNFRWYKHNDNAQPTNTVSINAESGNIYASSFIKSGGTSSQFLKADGSVDSNTYATAAQLTNGSVTKLGTATVGGTAKPIYLNAGTPTALSTTVGSWTKPIFLNAGTLTALSYLDSTVIREPNHTSISPTSMPLVGTTKPNRLALLPASQIIIEQTTDGGETWVDAGYSDAQKENLFLGNLATASIAIPRIDGVRNKLCGVRITITGMRYNVPDGTTETQKYNYWNSNYVASTERYCTLDGCYLWVNAINDRIRTRVYRATGVSPNNWIATDGDAYTYLRGWDGGNYIYLKGANFGGGTTQTGNYWNYRFEFFTDGVDGGNLATTSTTSRQSIGRIYGYGRSGWSLPNYLMAMDHIYTWDISQTAIFPNGIRPSISGKDLGTTSYRWNVFGAELNLSGNTTLGGTLTVGTSSANKATTLYGTLKATGNATAASFIKSGGTSGQFLKADGSVDSNTYALSSAIPTVDATPTASSTNAVSSGGVYSMITQNEQDVAQALNNINNRVSQIEDGTISSDRLTQQEVVNLLNL